MTDDRRSIVEQARVQWMTRLTDYSRANPLLYHRPHPLDAWEVPEPHRFSLHQLIAGVRTPVSRLSPAARLLDEADEVAVSLDPDSVPDDAVGAVRRLETIHQRHMENVEETGIESMYLTYGVATWPASDGGLPPAAPVFMVSVLPEASLERIALQRTADPELNLDLMHLLEGWGCPPVDPSILSELTTANTADVGGLLDRLVDAVNASAASVVPGFHIDQRVLIGNFCHDRVPVVRDLAALAPRLADNVVIAALAGDPGARKQLADEQAPIKGAALETAAPDDEFSVIDCDGSQRAVVAAVLAGRNAIVSGPPGTGKTQTIANLIVELIAAGKTVLVGIGKGAQIDEVKSRLAAVGLEREILDLHAVVTRREYMEQFADAVEAVREAVPVPQTPIAGELARRRDILVAHARRMNDPQPPTGLTLFTLLGAVQHAPQRSRSSVRFRGNALAGLDAKGHAEAEKLVTDEATVDDLLFGTNPSPWATAQLFSEADAHKAHAAAVTLDRAWAQFGQSLDGVLGETRLRRPKDLVEVTGLASMVGLAGRLHRVYTDRVWKLDLDDVNKGLTIGMGEGRASTVARATHGQYKRAHRDLVSTRTGPEAGATLSPDEDPAQTLHPELLELIRVREVWRIDGPAGAAPRGSAWLPPLEQTLEKLDEALPDLQKAFPGGDFRTYPLESLPALLRGLAADAVTVMRVPTHCASTKRIGEMGLQPLLDLIVGERRPKETWLELYRTARLQSALDAAWANDPGLGAFDGVAHDVLVTQFTRLDRDRAAIAAARLRRSYAEGAVTAMNARPDQTALVRQETAKREAIMEPRQLHRAAGEVMTALKPCWMASPLEVSHQIDGSRVHFDVAILDEANLLLPEEAVPTLARARTSVIFGDAPQLPARHLVPWRIGPADEDTTPEGTDGIMQTLSTFLTPMRLRTHYRSVDERLVALSNSARYDGAVLTFPSPEADPPISFELVDATSDSGPLDTSAAEVARVVELIAEHARSDVDRSLGVIACSTRHARRLRSALALARRSDPELDGFCGGRKEEVFLKGLSRVQGDVRDVCIVSLGYRKARDGGLPHGFGQLGRDGGERRLNVAMTRARRRMVVVSAVGPDDLAVDGPPGVQLLRRLMRYAKDPASEEVAVAAADRRSAMELDVEKALRERSVPLTARLGLSGMRIDLALAHPQRPGVHVLALEVDGPSYAGLPTARDRDRLRREHLERLGWGFMRLWALEWYLRPGQALDRILEEWRAAAQRYELRARGEFAAPPQQVAAAATAVSGPTPQRGPRPAVPPGRQITAYSQHEIWLVVTWVISDGFLRTDDEIVAEVARELAFPNLDPVVDAAIRAVVRPG